MDERTAGALVCGLCGALALRLVLTGEISSYVSPLLQPLLIGAGLVLVLLGALSVGLARAGRGSRTHHHHGVSGITCLVGIPLLSVALIGPAPLTSATAVAPVRRSVSTERAAAPGGATPGMTTPSVGPVTTTPKPTGAPSPDPVWVDPVTGRTRGGYAGDDGTVTDDQGSSHPKPVGDNGDFPALKGNPAELSLYEYVARSASDKGADTLRGRRLRITGFVSVDPGRPNGPWVLTRLKMWCCVADAMPFMVSAVSAPATPPGTWVELIGTALPNDSHGDSRIRVQEVRAIPAPSDPYLW